MVFVSTFSERAWHLSPLTAVSVSVWKNISEFSRVCIAYVPLLCLFWPGRFCQFLSFFLFCCCQAHHILVFIHIACIHPITMHSLTDSYLFAWLCSCHIHCICGYWIMDHAHDSFIEYQGFIHTGFVQKNPFKIHKLFTNLCNMGQKSNTKVRNSAAYLVKGHNPYCSQRLMHFISQNWLEVHSLWFCTAIFLDIFLKLLFGLGKCSFWLISW